MISLTSAQINTSLLWKKEELDFLEKYRNAKHTDIFDLYKKSEINVSQKILHQLYARQQIKDKLPFLYQNPQIVYPATLSLEQSSSEATALFKASLFQGKKFIDLTGGMGVDSYFFSKKFDTGILVEPNVELAETTSHNYALLRQENIRFAMGIDAENFVSEFSGKVDLIYIDPARRDNKGGKVVLLDDCEPNVLYLLDKLFALSDNIVIKTSPLLDIHLAATALGNVRKVHVLAVENECKELVFHLDKKFVGDWNIETVNFEKGKEIHFSFMMNDEKKAELNVGGIKRYLYEPNAAVLKAGGFKSIALAYGLNKLHANSHLYTSDEIKPNFPGRCFEIWHQTKVDKHIVQKLIPGRKANVSIRNFPGSVQDLRKKLGLQDGGDWYVFATMNASNNKVLLITTKFIF